MKTRIHSPKERPHLLVDILLLVFAVAGIAVFIAFRTSLTHSSQHSADSNTIRSAVILGRTIVLALLGAGSVAVALSAQRRGCLILKRAAALGLALFCVVFVFRLTSEIIAGGAQSFGAFLAMMSASLNNALKVFFATLLAGASGSAIWRRLGAQRSLLWTQHERAWVSLSVACLRGHLGAGIGIGLLSAISLGFTSWTGRMMDVFPDTSGLAGAGTPGWMYVFAAALVSGITVELGLRLLGTGLVVQWTGRLSLAVLLSGLFHAVVVPTTDLGAAWLMAPPAVAVPVLVLTGSLLAILALRYGVAASITASYLMTATILGIPAASASSTPGVVLIVLIMALPFLLCIPGLVVAYSLLRKKREEGEVSPPVIDIIGVEALSRLAVLREVPPGHAGPAAFLEDKTVLSLAARRGDDIVGFIAVRKAETGPSEVLDLFVREEERRMYLGSRLLHEAREILKVEGRRALRVLLEEGDLAGRAFFDASGLEPSQVVARSAGGTAV